MEKEIKSLSDKEGIGEYLPNWAVYKKEDVKEFIKTHIDWLKNKMCHCEDCCIGELKERAGKDLI